MSRDLRALGLHRVRMSRPPEIRSSISFRVVRSQRSAKPKKAKARIPQTPTGPNSPNAIPNGGRIGGKELRINPRPDNQERRPIPRNQSDILGNWQAEGHRGQVRCKPGRLWFFPRIRSPKIPDLFLKLSCKFARFHARPSDETIPHRLICHEFADCQTRAEFSAPFPMVRTSNWSAKSSQPGFLSLSRRSCAHISGRRSLVMSSDCSRRHWAIFP